MQGLATIDVTIGRSARRLNVLAGPERRRSYSEAEKARLVAETLQPRCVHCQHRSLSMVCTRSSSTFGGGRPGTVIWPCGPRMRPCLRRWSRKRRCPPKSQPIPWRLRPVGNRARDCGSAAADRRRCLPRARRGVGAGAARGRMILPAGPLRIFVATRPVDFREGMDGLAAVAQEQLRLDSISGAISVFRARRADGVRIPLERQLHGADR